jgi:hypothetical protein
MPTPLPDISIEAAIWEISIARFLLNVRVQFTRTFGERFAGV